MKGSKNITGRLTEAIMTRVREKLPDISTEFYNRIFEAVSAGLTHTDGIAVVPDNDWAFMAVITNWPKEKKQRFYNIVRQWFPEIDA